MWQHATTWLNNIPIPDPLRRQQALLLQVSLVALGSLSDEPTFSAVLFVSTLFFIFCCAAFLVVLGKSKPKFAAAGISTLLLAALAVNLFTGGLQGNVHFLVTFFTPITLSGFVLGRGALYPVEYRLRSKTGDWKWVPARGGCGTGCKRASCANFGTIMYVAERRHVTCSASKRFLRLRTAQWPTLTPEDLNQAHWSQLLTMFQGYMGDCLPQPEA